MHKQQDVFKDAKQEYIEKAQKVARDLLMRRDTITIEDVTAVCPLPKHLHRNTLGRVFHNPIFRSVGYTAAKRREARGHVIKIWTLRPELFDERQLGKRWQEVMGGNRD